jgi:hypothetical protein
MRSLWVVPLALSLTGCNWLNHITGLSKDGDRATGAACRQTGRSLEECYRRNPDADRAQIFAGWREMQEYMTKEHLPTMSPPPDPVPVASAPIVAAPKPTADVSQQGNSASMAPSDGGGGSAPDPEVQAVLDTINNRPGNSNAAAQPSQNELQQLKKVLDNQGQQQSPPPAQAHGKKKS